MVIYISTQVDALLFINEWYLDSVWSVCSNDMVRIASSLLSIVRDMQYIYL